MQKRAARFVTGNYSYETGSMTGILVELKWETLQKRGKDNGLILLYKGLKGKARIPTDDLIPKNRLVKMPTRKVSFPKLSGTGMSSLILSSPLLKCRTIVYLNLLPL